MGKGIVGIDGSKLASPQKTGVEKTVFYIVKNLLEIDPKNKYLLYAAAPIKNSDFKNANERIVPGKRCWHRFHLPLALFKDKPEKFLSISNFIPALAPEKSVQLLHDFAFRFFPEAYSKKELYLQEEAIEFTTKRAKCIIFTSEANRQDFIKFYGIPSVKDAVIPLAYDDTLFKPIKNPQSVLKCNDYILFVGRLEEKKNVPNIIRAYNSFRDKSKANPKLVLAGKPGYGFTHIEEEIKQSKYSSDIIIPGYVEEKDLPHLYANAKLLFFPSLYEGFGIPALEAMAVGIPVITSNIPTMKEVAGNAAMFVDPRNIEEMAKKLDNLVNDSSIASELVQKGFKQASKYSWRKTAKMIDELMENL